jgi:hypothetical protein
VQPLQLLNLDGKKFSLLGDLDEAMNSGAAKLPAIKKDIATAGQIQGTRSSTVKASLGLDILGNILGALTGTKLDVSAGFQNASTLTFEFGDVTVSTVSIILLDKYLNVATIDPTAKQIKQLMQAGNAAVTTAVARSKKYIVSAQNDKGNDIKADVPVIKGIASGNVSVSTTGRKNQKVVFEGPDRSRLGCRRHSCATTSRASLPHSIKLPLDRQYSAWQRSPKLRHRQAAVCHQQEPVY